MGSIQLRPRRLDPVRIAEGLPAALAAVLLLGGCEGFEPAWEPQTIDASRSVIGFEHEDYDPKRAEYLLQHDRRSGNDVYLAQFAGADAVATLAAYKTGPGFAIGERPIEAYVADLLQDTQLTWGDGGRASTRLGSVPYRLFQIVDRPWSCVGFGQPRGEMGYVDFKSDIVFGFFCRSEARPMSAAAAQDLIGRVSLGARR